MPRTCKKDPGVHGGGYPLKLAPVWPTTVTHVLDGRGGGSLTHPLFCFRFVGHINPRRLWAPTKVTSCSEMLLVAAGLGLESGWSAVGVAVGLGWLNLVVVGFRFGPSSNTQSGMAEAMPSPSRRHHG